MSRELPFPITFELPAGWTLVSPDDSGQSDAAYAACAAVRDANATDPVATNFIIGGLGMHDAGVDVAALAATQLANLKAKYAVTGLKSDVMNHGPAQEVAQLLQIDYATEETITALRQIRIMNAFAGEEDPGAVAVVQLVMTCPAEVFDEADPNSVSFVASSAPAASPTTA